jgi:hypothetical protein
VVNVAKDEKKSKDKGDASKASKDLKDKKSSPEKKSAAASALSKSSDKDKKDRKKMPSPRSLPKKRTASLRRPRIQRRLTSRLKRKSDLEGNKKPGIQTGFFIACCLEIRAPL